MALAPAALLLSALFCSASGGPSPLAPVVDRLSPPHRIAADSLAEAYRNGETWSDFLVRVQVRRDLWHANWAAWSLDETQLSRARATGGPWRIFVISDQACSDSVNTIPILARLAEAQPGTEIRLVEADVGRPWMEAHRSPDGRASTPTVLLLDEALQLRGCWVEQPKEMAAFWLPTIPAGTSRQELPRKMAWYAEDAGRSTLNEFLEVMEVAARGGLQCPGVVQGPALGQGVSGLTVQPREGFVTLRWNPVSGAAAYEIVRVSVDASGAPSAPEAVVGMWRPNRQLNPETPTFADAGLIPGVRYGWQVRAVAEVDGVTSPLGAPSDWVRDAALAAPGPEAFLTAFEQSEGATYTPYEAEMEWTERIAAASPRVRVETIGRTLEGRAIHLFIFGYPEAPPTLDAILAAPRAGANCGIHGNEPSGREGCFMMIRELAFSDDPKVLEILSGATVLIVPSINGDGRAANARGNAAGQDLNRDHARITQPETQAFARFLRDYAPQVMVDGHEYGNANTCDLPLLWPRHSNTAPTVHAEAKEGLVEGWFYEQGAADGWWPCPYPVQGIAGAQTFTRVAGLKNLVVTLVEARSQGGPTRPGESDPAANRRRKAYSQLWSIRQALAYHHAEAPRIQAAIEAGIAFQTSNVGPVVFHGDWDVAGFPAPHPGETPPPPNPPGPDQQLNPAPCAYFIPTELYTRPLEDSPNLPEAFRTTLGERLGFHGVRVEAVEGGFRVPLAQPLRGLINILLDPDTPPTPIAAATRVMTCAPGAG